MTKKKNRKKLKKGRYGFLAFFIVLALFCLLGLLVFDYHERLIPKQYRSFVNTASEKYDVPVDVIYGVIKTESNFKEEAISNAGAYGLMQITEDTFEWLQQQRNESYDVEELLDPQINIDYGVYYLSYLYDLFGKWDIAFAAYNAGPNVVSSWLSDEGTLASIPYSETERYVEKVNEAISRYQEQ